MKGADKTEEEELTDKAGSCNILLVDDDPNSLNALKRAFRSEYNIFLASNAEDALAIIKQHDIGLVIADYRMPGMSGAELLENAHGYLAKPWTPEEIRSTVRKWEASEVKHKQTEKELEETRKYAQELVCSSLNMIIAVDKDRKIIEFNRAAQEMFGYSREEVVGKDVGMLYSDPEDGLMVYKTTKETGSLTCEIMNKRKNGESFPAFISASILHNTEGDFIGVMGISRDITEKKRAEEALENYAIELERSNRELQQFAYVASHDLQEPLRMVSSYMQLLERRYKGKLGSDADDFIAYAVNGAVRMQDLINDLLVYSRVNTQGKDLAPTDCEVVLERTLTNLRLTIEDAAAVITHDALPTAMADDPQLGQLLQNLIGNAIKFRGEEPPSVHISVAQRGDEWLFSVRDNGIGIDQEYAERIFVIFQRLHNREEYPGTGIGLAICKRIVERHGGQIWMESQPGDGSIFYFTIPRSSAI